MTRGDRLLIEQDKNSIAGILEKSGSTSLYMDMELAGQVLAREKAPKDGVATDVLSPPDVMPTSGNYAHVVRTRKY